MGTDEQGEKYRLKALQMLIQDLAEIWLGNDIANPRSLGDLHDSRCGKLASKIAVNTSTSPISSRSIRKFKNGEMPGSANLEILSAAWFVATGAITTDGIVKDYDDKIHGYWEKYIELFRSRKETLNDLLGKSEGENLEFKEKIETAEGLAMMICAFANLEGGYIVFGISKEDEKLQGININSPLIKITSAALRRFGSATKPRTEFGWGYILNEDKTFFVIKVHRDISGVIYKANGKQYIKHGAEYRTVGKNDRENDTYEAATISRSNLIENVRRIKSIVGDHIDYWEKYKDPPPSYDERKTFYLMSLRFIAGTFITYLSSIWKEVSIKTISVDNLHLYKLVENDIDFSTKELRKGKVELFLNRVETIPEIHSTVFDKIEDLTRLFLDNQTEISSAEVYEGILLVSDMAKQIDLETNKRFHLMQTQVRI